jgi:hypothetical protein
MHHLGVPTTRALSLVASNDEYIPRAWYRKDEEEQEGAKEGAECSDVEAFDFKQFDYESKSVPRPHTPNVMHHERCAITCRVAPSFVRVGHFEVRKSACCCMMYDTLLTPPPPFATSSTPDVRGGVCQEGWSSWSYF